MSRPTSGDHSAVRSDLEVMMPIDAALLEVRAYSGQGYQPLVDYGEWRVAILRYSDELLPHHIPELQRHDETDEVFVLLQGHCILFIGEGDDHLVAIHAQDMEPSKLYNVKKGVWHTHTLSEDASVLVVENRDTTLDNSPRLPLSAAQRERLVQLTQALWHQV